MSDADTPDTVAKTTSSTESERLFHMPPHFVCRDCHAPIALDAAQFESHFRGAPVTCPRCNHAHDWWDTMLTDIREWFALDRAAVLAGASQTFANVRLPGGETREVDLVAAGVPEHAEIIALNMTSAGSARPLLAHSNRVSRELGPKFWVYGVKYKDEPTDGPLYISAVWFARSDADTVVRHLVDAACHYAAERYEAQILSANIAAEAALTPAVQRWLRGFGNSKGRAAFFSEMTYSYVLHVLLDVAADTARLPRLAPNIRAALNRMRSLRNDMVHEGACEHPDREGAAELLTAAIFGVRYAQFLDAQSGTRDQPLPDGLT